MFPLLPQLPCMRCSKGNNQIWGLSVRTIKTYYGPEQAMTAMSLLQANGIEARLLDSATLSVLPLDSVALGGYRLAVHDDAAERAIDLLAEHDAPAIDQQSQQYFGDEYDDEAVQAQRIKRKRAQRILLLIGLLFLASLMMTQFGRSLLAT